MLYICSMQTLKMLRILRILKGMVANWATEKCFLLNEDTLQETKPSCGTACATKRLECWIVWSKTLESAAVKCIQMIVCVYVCVFLPVRASLPTSGRNQKESEKPHDFNTWPRFFNYTPRPLVPSPFRWELRVVQQLTPSCLEQHLLPDTEQWLTLWLTSGISVSVASLWLTVTHVAPVTRCQKCPTRSAKCRWASTGHQR